MKNVLVGQSGGPTSAINATLAGVVEQAMISGKVDKIYGMHHGIQGVLDDDIIDIGAVLSAPDALIRLARTPSSALGSCRFKLKSAEEAPDTYKKIFETFRKYNIGYVVYIGGNDSMDTVLKLSAYAKATGVTDIAIMGAPKTVDNDLNGMDHSPGFSSAARYVITTISELWCDAKVYNVPAVTIVETMGRHAGWLCASSVLARKTSGAPHLIYLPEVVFDEKQFVEDVKEQMAKTPYVVVCASEGIKRADGSYLSDDGTGKEDAFGHKQLQGAGSALKAILNDAIDCKVRTADLSIMQRSGAHLASEIDLQESRMLGATAMSRALDGVSGEVPVLNRIGDDPYRIAYSTIPSDQVANIEKSVPREWINERGNFVTDEMVRYIEPLVGTIPTNHLYFY